MSLAFLSCAAPTPAESPFADAMARDGARFEVQDGWRVADGFGDVRQEQQACTETVGWADASSLGKWEVSAAPGEEDALDGVVPGLGCGRAVAEGPVTWLRLRPGRALLLAEARDGDALRQRVDELSPQLRTVDVTAQHAGLRLRGPGSRETFARFCALDLRPDSVPVGGVRPGSVARTPGIVVREAEDQYLVLAGAAYATYLWTVVGDAGRHLGGAPVGAGRMRTDSPLVGVGHA